ncbi:MAG: hypothetical protein AAFW70_25975 [Cyanobacteria bacterium J06635_10]
MPTIEDVVSHPAFLITRYGRWGDGEVGRWGDGEMGRWGDGEVGRWGDGELFKFLLLTPYSLLLTPYSLPLTLVMQHRSGYPSHDQCEV